MMSSGEIDAREALRERLGKGARYDSLSAPASELQWARLGTAYFARQLNELSDEALDRPSLVPGWTRRHVIASVGFQARALARLVEAARLGKHEETLEEPEAQNEDVIFGATLPDHALRYLFKHSEVHLNVEWRDLDERGWRSRVKSLAGDVVDIGDTPWLRARAIWLCAVDLDNGASFLDFPPEIADRLLRDVAEELAAHGGQFSCTLKPTDRSGFIRVGSGGQVISGRIADLLRWLTGRGARRLVFDGKTEDPSFWSGRTTGFSP
ncbi:maleylpyruvate isomerase N-terminal domain-containing protein [Rhizobium sp. BK602]|uniref:maleylpyruvate isomerase N-terminal domain-containing protein n=1 Tax=Rhizobium sp. BK602 TaxID=2586986 RepID=UPI00182A1192|nr:maleylpyruvate isomerase N-terminal domain-containing protein [Rhizobium sp. BK602]MBB3610443.1 maleylpyruvate isomerase [Rhizobium sp. BK602]